MSPLLAAAVMPPRFYGITFLQPNFTSFGAISGRTQSQYCPYCGGLRRPMWLNPRVAVEHVADCHAKMVELSRTSRRS